MDSTWSRSQGRAANRYGRRGEGADRADLHGVAREVRGEGQLGEGVDLELLAPADEVDLGLAGHLVGEPGAPAALDAALAVEQHQLGDGDGLLEVALLLDEPGLARPVGQGLVLQRALAALVAHRAVERVVDQQELEHPVLGLLDLVGVGDHLGAPACTSTKQLGCSEAPRGPLTSTRHIRHTPTDFIRGW